MLIELACGIGLVALYHFEVERAALVIPLAANPVGRGTLLAQFTAHAALLAWMLVATFIDFDEQTIPDAITLPGTLLGLVLLTAVPAAAPLTLSRPGWMESGTPLTLEPLLLTSPNPWTPWLDSRGGLAVGAACFAAWVLAVWPRTLTLRRGVARAVRYAWASMFRVPHWWLYPAVLATGLIAIGAVWSLGGAPWRSLLSSLVGVAFGAGLVWAVRLAGYAALRKEAMGFGDVTLMGMIGAYLGWQSTLIVFFLAPFVAVFICLGQWLLTRRRDIAFGPFLCGAALLLILRWSAIWEQQAAAVFGLGRLVPCLLFFCLLLLAGMLRLWHLGERLLTGAPGDR
jgi:prepilin signal peptidase PulO-like enzyme (type II secretory pathway)